MMREDCSQESQPLSVSASINYAKIPNTDGKTNIFFLSKNPKGIH